MYSSEHIDYELEFIFFNHPVLREKRVARFTDLAYKLFTWKTKDDTLKIYIKNVLVPTAYRLEYWLHFLK
jgi:hypothetical protein